MKKEPNKIGRVNCRPASPFDAGREFESASCASPSPSAAVAHLWRSAKVCGCFVRQLRFWRYQEWSME
jgi:hypothetical protein